MGLLINVKAEGSNPDDLGRLFERNGEEACNCGAMKADFVLFL